MARLRAQLGDMQIRGGIVFGGFMTLINDGLISAEAAGRTLTITPVNGFTNNGTIRSTAGTASVNSSAFTNNGIVEARSGGLIRIQTGSVHTNTATLLAGAGGRIEFANGLTQTAAGTIEIELGGLNTNQFGRLTITGAAALGGTLALSPANGFTPDWGDAWTIITYGSRSGDFSTFDTPALADADWTWWTENNATTYRVGVRHIADLNYDGAINFGDLNIVLGNYNQPGSALQGDISGDGLINFADLNIVLGLFNLTAPTNVPAPGAAALLALSILTGARRRR